MAGSRFVWIAVALAIPGAAVASWPLKDYLLIRNFHVVEPGAIYRGGEQKAGPLKRVIQRHGIRSVVCLAAPDLDEQAVAKSLGVQWFLVPLGGSSAAGIFDDLEQAAGILADPANRPVFFHCVRGVYRSNLTQAVYRMKHCGWTLDQSLEELRATGYDPQESGGDNCCAELLTRYYRERILACASE